MSAAKDTMLYLLNAVKATDPAVTTGVAAQFAFQVGGSNYKMHVENNEVYSQIKGQVVNSIQETLIINGESIDDALVLITGFDF